MRFPWISRGSHMELVLVLKSQLVEMGEERKVLLDRLASLGLGGPLFSSPAVDFVAAEEASEVEAANAELEQLTRLRRRPSQLAEALTRKAHREHNKPPAAQRMAAALDKAEAAGKNQA